MKEIEKEDVVEEDMLVDDVVVEDVVVEDVEVEVEVDVGMSKHPGDEERSCG